jgi:hypothetical protein
MVLDGAGGPSWSLPMILLWSPGAHESTRAAEEERMTQQTGTATTTPSDEAMRAKRTAAMNHVPKLVRTSDMLELLHGTGPVGRFNSRLAVAITRSVGTMWAAYVFALLAFVSLPQALTAFLHGDTVVGITWLSQSFLQLVLLPIIIVGQNIISAAQDARAEADHETLLALHTIDVQQLLILEQQQQILDGLKQKIG